MHANKQTHLYNYVYTHNLLTTDYIATYMHAFTHITYIPSWNFEKDTFEI